MLIFLMVETLPKHKSEFHSPLIDSASELLFSLCSLYVVLRFKLLCWGHVVLLNFSFQHFVHSISRNQFNRSMKYQRNNLHIHTLFALWKFTFRFDLCISYYSLYTEEFKSNNYFIFSDVQPMEMVCLWPWFCCNKTFLKHNYF